MFYCAKLSFANMSVGWLKYGFVLTFLNFNLLSKSHDGHSDSVLELRCSRNHCRPFLSWDPNNSESNIPFMNIFVDFAVPDRKSVV